MQSESNSVSLCTSCTCVILTIKRLWLDVESKPKKREMKAFKCNMQSLHNACCSVQNLIFWHYLNKTSDDLCLVWASDLLPDSFFLKDTSAESGGATWASVVIVYLKAHSLWHPAARAHSPSFFLGFSFKHFVSYLWAHHPESLHASFS